MLPDFDGLLHGVICSPSPVASDVWIMAGLGVEPKEVPAWVINTITDRYMEIAQGLAQFERSMIRKRQAEGIAIAKAAKDGRYKGRKQSIDRAVITNMLDAGSSVTAVARSLKISRQSVYRIKAEIEVA